MRISVNNLGGIGLITDPYEQDVPANAFTRVKNARFGDKGARAFKGHSQVLVEDGASTPITPLWLKFFPSRTDPRWAIADNNAVYVYQDFEWTNITRAAGAYNAVDRWQGSLFNNIGILNNGFDDPQEWNPTDSSQVLVDLTNWPASYRCRSIRPFKNFLIAGHIFDGTDTWPQRMMWSHPAAPGTIPSSWDVTDPAVDAGHFDLGETSDAVIDGLQLGDLFIVYREQTTYAMALTGTSRIFRNYPISQAAGLLWKDCMVETPRGHLAIGWEDIVVHRGSAGTFESVVDSRTRKWINSRRSQEFYYNSFAVINEPETEVWCCFPEEGHQYANLAYIWNWKRGPIGVRDLPNVPFADAGPILLEE